jgi:uncharacterized protein (DUF58 family)
MASSVLSHYLDGSVLSRLAGRRIEPRGLVIGSHAGAHRSPLAGFAVEFTGHREYARGDDPKHIDWRVFFRRDKYFIKQYEMETNFVCHLVLDTSASMRYGQGDEQKLLFAARMATTLAYAVARQGDQVSFTTFDEHLRESVPPSNSIAHIVRIAEHIDQLPSGQKTNLADALGELVGRTQRREIVMIFSDFFGDLDSLEPVLQRLKFQRHEVVLFQIMHHDELAFDLKRMTRFVGLEQDETWLASPQEIRRAYLAAVERFNTRLAEMCHRNRVERVLVDTSRVMAGILVDYLNQRSAVR